MTEARTVDASFAARGCGASDTLAVRAPFGAYRLQAVRPPLGARLFDDETARAVARVTGIRAVRLSRRRRAVRFRATATPGEHACTTPGAYSAQGGRWVASTTLSIRYRVNRRVRLPSCGNTSYGGRVAPRTWDAGCTGSNELVRARWRHWGRRVATARGQTVVRTCDPNCAEGGSRLYPASARASRIGICKDDHGRRRPFYTRVRLTIRVPRGKGLPGIEPGRHVTRFGLTCQH